MEQYTGHYLKEDEVVHHINGHKLDNRINNLKIMDKKEHIIMHNKEGIGKMNFEWAINKGITKKTLIELYWKKKLSTYDIAKIYNCDNTTVYNYLKKFNINIRNKIESQYNRWKKFGASV